MEKRYFSINRHVFPEQNILKLLHVPKPWATLGTFDKILFSFVSHKILKLPDRDLGQSPIKSVKKLNDLTRKQKLCLPLLCYCSHYRLFELLNIALIYFVLHMKHLLVL